MLFRSYARVAPLLTVYSGQARPDPNFASGQVLQALGEDPEPILARRKARVASPDDAFLGGGSGTYSIDSRARLPHGHPARLRLVVRAGIGTIPSSEARRVGEECGHTCRSRWPKEQYTKKTN